MNINEILILIGLSAGALVIGGWVILYYATLRDKEYEEIAAKQNAWVNEQVQKQIDKDREERKNKPKNQTVKTDFTDDDVPF